jgi:membrane protein YqaA with SNARE-associated domain
LEAFFYAYFYPEMDFSTLGYVGLCLAGFLSSTILPMNSEGVLFVLLTQDFDPWTCLIVATVGNSLGGLTNYWIGSFGKTAWLKRFGVSTVRLQQLEQQVHKYGYWLAFFSWVPFIGDPLTIALGYFRVSFPRVVGLMVLGKFLRYALLIWFVR